MTVHSRPAANPASGVRIVRPATELRGDVTVPGDKSITHRAVMLNAIARGTATVTGAGLGADCLSTAACMRALGATVRRRWPNGALTDDLRRNPATGQEERADAVLVVEGAGTRGLHEPESVLDAGNSGTTARLLTGILAAQPFLSVLTGDASLRSRPMGRVIQPLRQLGAHLAARREDTLLPLVALPAALKGATLEIKVASAQLKSCLLLAGLYADGVTEIAQPEESRDHTERMLTAQGAEIVRITHSHGARRTESAKLQNKLQVEASVLRIKGLPLGSDLRAIDVVVPGDISSAAFWLVAGVVHPNARVVVRNVGINPSRTGILDVLREMGGRIALENERLAGGEPVADLVAESSELRGVDVGGALIPRLIDEVPVLAVAAAVARGRTTIRDAAELRVKESDRLAATARELGALGARVQELDDGLVIEGGTLRGGEVESHDDHRMAMSLAVAALAAGAPALIAGGDCVDISYPTFWPDLERLAPGTTREA